MDKKDLSVDDIIAQANAAREKKLSAKNEDFDNIDFSRHKNSTIIDDSDIEPEKEIVTTDSGEKLELTVDEILDETKKNDAEISDLTFENTAEKKREPISEEKVDKADADYIEKHAGVTPVEDIPEKKPAPVRKKKKIKKKKKGRVNNSIFGGIILITIIVTISMVLAVGGITVATEYYGIGKDDNDVIFNIPEGSDNDKLAELLYNNGIINNKTLFKLAIKLKRPAVIYPGDITLQASMGYSDVIDELATSRNSYETVDVTIKEGMSLLDVANLLEENKICTADDFLFEFNKDQGFDFEKNLSDDKNAFYRMEGYFYPDTYNFYVDDTGYNITKIVREHFSEMITPELQKQIDASGMTLNEVITLASIVQLEAASVDEMPTVASVFLNRLDDPDTFPMLQSDTTDKYINNVIKTEADNQASIDHYTESYDTYKCKGLPAGAICNPGIDAIKAVVNPKKTTYYYFCNNLKTGQTYYAETLEEHEANLVEAGLA